MTRLKYLIGAFLVIAAVCIVLAVLLPGLRPGSSAVLTGRRGSLLDRKGRVLAEDDSALDGQQARRRYPFHDTLSNLIGFPDRAGLEQSLDSLLKPKRRITGGMWAGQDVKLTIDLDLQRAVFTQLRRHVINTRSARGSAVILRPRTGEALALVDYPGYDPLRHRLYPPEVWRCHGVTDAFEPGPAFAPVAGLAAAAGSGLSAGDQLDSIYARLLPRALREAARRLGFGTATGIELASEAAGALPDGEATSARASLLQLAQAYGVLAAGGRLFPPFLVYRNGRRGVETVIDARRAKTLTEWSTTGVGISYKAVCAGGGKVTIVGAAADTTTDLNFVGFPLGPAGSVVVAVQLFQPLAGYYSPDAASVLFEDIVNQVPAAGQ